MSTVSVRGVHHAFGEVRAVDGVDLVVPQGSLTAVLGPSGCGKTTLLRLIAGFLQPQSGTIAFDDRVVAGEGRSVPPQERRVGYVPQEGALFPHLDVAANIGFGLPRAERRSDRITEMLDLVELPAAYASRGPHELSGGQQQRVALARALAPRPSVVLLDEPFSSLDASLRASTGRAVARALHAADATAVLVTHDQDEALSLADQVAVMRSGRLVQAARPRELYRSPGDADVARFVGGAAILPATVAGDVATFALGRAPVHGHVADGPTQVVVRPEQVAIGDGGHDARVDEVSFYGHDAAVRLDLLPDGPTLVARVPGLLAPEPGSEVAVRVTGEVHCLPA
ncbi:ABC transporter ATP-binding protein [Nocardioides euryhalodurans]|uniref:ABC-type quaternary amine transporter n=1 Tax=Nocardioides euryhalodurans TaxID=2518370 RepID=A0A4V1BDR3_9ACTN|nr:ABC transporter ATP-binding protein [Nocardioides euryhalodurans]QBR92022.1 ABC transporter ATP-binding protein [Nocardioides euryhalodurans]